MHYCQSCSIPTPMAPAAGLAMCPTCGEREPAARQPLFVVTGASGAGKSTMFAPLARELAAEAAVFDADWLIDPFAMQAGGGALNWPAIRAGWLSVAHGVAQAGKPTVLLGPLAGFHLEDLEQARWIDGIHFFLLDCPDDERRRRLEARPSWRDREIEEQVAWGRSLREHVTDAVDTSGNDVAATVAAVAAWFRSSTGSAAG